MMLAEKKFLTVEFIPFFWYLKFAYFIFVTSCHIHSCLFFPLREAYFQIFVSSRYAWNLSSL
jgi:hypothetical protein